MSFNDILSKGFDSHHFVSGLASHFRDLLVSKTPSTLSLLEVRTSSKMYGQQSQKCSQDFFVKRNRYCK
jgi:DNA polymerase-3 subunit gamma/tau